VRARSFQYANAPQQNWPVYFTALAKCLADAKRISPDNHNGSVDSLGANGSGGFDQAGAPNTSAWAAAKMSILPISIFPPKKTASVDSVSNGGGSGILSRCSTFTVRTGAEMFTPSNLFLTGGTP